MNSYSCRLSIGNFSLIETNAELALVKKFASCFRLRDFFVEKKQQDGYTFYLAYFVYENELPVKLMHFVSCVSSFALLNGIQLAEIAS
jgi:hypothetical protein